ncbi:MAG: hypothetical protein HY981_02805, partial [Candidatus Magasanikbacteria bacterium]|nr:hypothetical protein [Candidatus Magasanikbacteria bacterium]
CDDGANNGKYGYCSFGCTTKGGGGFCGDGKFDIKNEICDASALNYHGSESDNITPFWSYKTGGVVTTSIGNGTQASWRDDNNLVACVNSSYQDGCVLSGAKYNPDKLMSCSWDCQSFDYCGDGKVNTTLKSDGKPYEECEKSETCQVGYCTYKNGTKFIKNNVGVLCENNVDCAPKALNIALSFCENHYKCSTDSSNAGDACTKNEDCVQNFICQDFEVGKRYCNMKSEFQPKLNVTAFGDDTAKFVSNACVWKSETVGVAIVTCLPLSAPPVQANAGVCGDGIIQDGKKGADGKLMPGHGELAPGAVPEVCDKGNDNGSIPIVEYGKTANYCAFGCGQVITVSGGFCGDKNVSGPEYCDASAASDDYVCRGTSTACNPKDSSPCSGSTKCVPSARWSEGAKNSCDATKQESTVPNGSFLTNCTNTCIGSCKVPVCGDKVVDPGEECDKGDPQTFKDGANGVVPVLAYNNSKKTQNYCDASCKNATVSNEYCGDEKLTSTEDCDTVNALSAFSDAATGKCSSSTFPQCDTTSCTSKCVSPPINDVNLLGVQGTSLIVEVVDQNGVYSPESLSDASDKLEVQWNGRTKYTLDNSNKFRIKFLNLIASPSGGSDGKITVTPVNNGSDFRYVALYAVPVNPSESSMSTNPNVWSWGGSTPVTEGVYISFTDPIDVVIKTKNP